MNLLLRLLLLICLLSSLTAPCPSELAAALSRLPALALLCTSPPALSWQIPASLPPERCQIQLSSREARRTGAES